MSGKVEEYLGGEVVEGTGASVNAPGLPSGTTSIWCTAEGGVVYLTINGPAGQLISPMHVPEDGARYLGDYDNIKSLGVFAAASVYAHLSYSKVKLPQI